jgi:hypothetical protein
MGVKRRGGADGLVDVDVGLNQLQPQIVVAADFFQIANRSPRGGFLAPER